MIVYQIFMGESQVDPLCKSLIILLFLYCFFVVILGLAPEAAVGLVQDLVPTLVSVHVLILVNDQTTDQPMIGTTPLTDRGMMRTIVVPHRVNVMKTKEIKGPVHPLQGRMMIPMKLGVKMKGGVPLGLRVGPLLQERVKSQPALHQLLKKLKIKHSELEHWNLCTRINLFIILMWIVLYMYGVKFPLCFATLIRIWTVQYTKLIELGGVGWSKIMSMESWWL